MSETPTNTAAEARSAVLFKGLHSVVASAKTAWERGDTALLAPSVGSLTSEFLSMDHADGLLRIEVSTFDPHDIGAHVEAPGGTILMSLCLDPTPADWKRDALVEKTLRAMLAGVRDTRATADRSEMRTHAEQPRQQVLPGIEPSTSGLRGLVGHARRARVQADRPIAPATPSVGTGQAATAAPSC